MRPLFIKKVTTVATITTTLLGVSAAYAGETDSLPLVIGMSLFTGGYSIVQDGQPGFIDYLEANFISTVSSEFLKFSLKAGKPNGGENGFPSTHTSVAAANSTLMGIKYGWKWGLGMSALTAVVAAEQFHHEKADVWDITAGALIGALSGYFATRPMFYDNALQVQPQYLSENKGWMMNVNYQL